MNVISSLILLTEKPYAQYNTKILTNLQAKNTKLTHSQNSGKTK